MNQIQSPEQGANPAGGEDEEAAEAAGRARGHTEAPDHHHRMAVRAGEPAAAAHCQPHWRRWTLRFSSPDLWVYFIYFIRIYGIFAVRSRNTVGKEYLPNPGKCV